MMVLIQGLIIGTLFGFVLEKGGVFNYATQINALLFRDMSMFKLLMALQLVVIPVMMLLKYFGVIEFSHEPFSIYNAIGGGLVFGIGWALMGFCPGTAVGGLGIGHMPIIAGLAGMITGGVLYAPLYPFFSKLFNDNAQYDLSIFGSTPLFLSYVIILLVYLFFFWVFHKQKI